MRTIVGGFVMSLFQRFVSVLALCAALAACADVPPAEPAPPSAPPSVGPAPQQQEATVTGAPLRLPPPPEPSNLHCDAMTIRQDGRDITPVNGTFILARQPFAIIYGGRGSEPSLYLSVRPGLNDALARLGQREVWGAADDVVRPEQDDLPIREGGRLVSDPDTQDVLLAAMGPTYPTFFRQMVIMNNEPGVLLTAIRTGDGFEQRDGVWVQNVRGLGGLPVAQSRFHQLHLTYFATVERLGPGGKGSFGSRLLQRLTWGSCRLSFLGPRF